MSNNDEQLMNIGAELAIAHYEEYKDKPEELEKYYQDIDRVFKIGEFAVKETIEDITEGTVILCEVH